MGSEVTQFKKGQSGNPKGKPKGAGFGGELREKCGKAFETLLAELMASKDAMEIKDKIQLASLLSGYALPKYAAIAHETGETAVTFRVVYEDETPLAETTEYEDITEDGSTD